MFLFRGNQRRNNVPVQQDEISSDEETVGSVQNVPEQQILDGEDVNDNVNANNNNNLTLDDIRDSIIAKNTLRSYVGDISQLLEWVTAQEELNTTWLTDYGQAQLTAINVRRPNETNGRYKSRKAIEIQQLVRESYEHPIIQIDNINPDKYMEFIMQLRGRVRRRYLKSSAYGNKRSALYHLFRLHNRQGFPTAFKLQLSNLFRGFKREITQYIEEPNGEEAVNNNKEGKEAMSVELYKMLLEWFLKYNTVDGVFAHCFLSLSWNLACRVGNTSRIAFQHIVWNQSFDSYTIAFSQTKTDQYGNEAKYPRHVYANPLNPIVCPVLSLSLYLTCCFNVVPNAEGLLLPGPRQYQRFSLILYRCLEENWERVSEMGYVRGEIGTHSIRKGAVSYFSSLPGGPPDAAICIRAGWTKGKVKDIYMRYVSAGDEFVGRSISLLSILREDFAASPPHFLDEEAEWIEQSRLLQFPMFHGVAGFVKVTRMCLASILYHQGWLLSFLHPVHIVFDVAYCFRTREVLSHHVDVVVTYPWNDTNRVHIFTGFPPHVSLLQQVCSVRDKQQLLVSEFVAEVTGLLRTVDGGRLSEQSLVRILEEFEGRFVGQLERTAAPPGAAVELLNDRPETGRRYMVHFYGGGIHRLPEDWRFPRCGVFDLWRQWMIGDDVRNIPPLRDLHAREYTHLVRLPLSEDERHGRSGGYSERRRPSRKIICDIKFLMNFITAKITERGVYRAEITPTTVDNMYLDAVDIFTEVERDAQKRWCSSVQSIRRRLNFGEDIH